jgi:O-succinylbenzoate synthase
MVLGAFFGTLDLIALARERNKNIIISSAFETPLGKSLLVLLAAASGSKRAHGLDTADFFANPFFKDPYPVGKGVIHFKPQVYVSGIMEKL